MESHSFTSLSCVITFFSSFSDADGDTPRMSYSFVSTTVAMDAVDVASAGRWMDKEKEPVENVLLAACLSFRKDALRVRCCLQAAGVLNDCWSDPPPHKLQLMSLCHQKSSMKNIVCPLNRSYPAWYYNYILLITSDNHPLPLQHIITITNLLAWLLNI